MAELLYRRDHLAAAIQGLPLPIRTEHLAAVNAASGWSPNRNTARKDARALVARGLLVRLGDGPYTYTRTEAPDA